MATAPARDEDFSRFVDEHTDALLVTAYLLTRNRHAAEELVQDSLVALYPRWVKVQAADSRTAYVRRALLNRFLNQQRRRQHSGTEPCDTPDPSGDLADTIAEQDHLRRALAQLPPRQHAALVLRYHYGLPDVEAAAELGCRIGTLSSLISRALTTLRADTSLTELDLERGRP